MLWGAFIGLTLLTAGAVILTIAILRLEQRHENQLVRESRPLLDAIRTMDESLAMMVSASRGYSMSRQTAFEQQYDDAVRAFGTAEALAVERARDPRDRQTIYRFRDHFRATKQKTDLQLRLTREGNNDESHRVMLEVAQARRSAPDYAELVSDRVRDDQAEGFDRLTMLRQWIMMAMIFVGLGLIAAAAGARSRIERQLGTSITRQVKRTETMIAGMADGVLLVDGDGNTVFINPAGQRLLGKADVGVPITKQAEVYRLRDEHGRQLDPQELPAAQALSTGSAVQDVTILIAREGSEKVAVSMSATPLHEDGRTSGVVVTFRDITERRFFEEQMQAQATRAQVLADAGAFFSSNIDPTWVTQAIAERTAEVLGDWSAVILRNAESKELSVASIYHRDMASLGLAWS
ncbi:MAG TPA: PAS domain-containing protein, partial [Thermoanaerobaculia bacterium]